jgi:hypothetical protein
MLSQVTLNDHVIIVSGFLEIKEFAKNKRGSQEEEASAMIRQTMFRNNIANQ